MNRAGLQHGSVSALVAIVAIGLSSCHHGLKAVQTTPAAVSAKRLSGGDANAWLSANGDLGDSSYCAAMLSLPLQPAAAWEYSYTAAEIGPRVAASLVHFDGVVAGSAISNVIFLLDAKSGREILKKNLYVPKESYATQQEGFFTLMFGPTGKLAAIDTLGRYNIWDAANKDIRRIGLSEEGASWNQGFVLTANELIGTHQHVLAGMSATDPQRTLWTEQLIFPSNGVVAARDGTVVAWTSRGTVACMSAEGSELWRSEEASLMHRVVLDPQEPLAYISPRNGLIICRDLHSGTERWRYDYTELIPAKERETRRQRFLDIVKDEAYSTGGLLPELKLMPVTLSATPRGLFVAFQSGDCVQLDRRGQLRWRASLGAMADSGIAFENGQLVHLSYEPLGIARLSGVAAEFLPYLLDAPSWPELEQRDKLMRLTDLDVMQELQSAHNRPNQPHSQPMQVVFGRFEVLDPNTGTVMDILKEGESVAGGPILPAKDRLIVALERSDNLYYPAPENKSPCRIVGYNWLSPGEQ